MSKLQTGSVSKGEKLSKEEGNSDKEAKGSVCPIASKCSKTSINPKSTPNKNLPDLTHNRGGL